MAHAQTTFQHEMHATANAIAYGEQAPPTAESAPPPAYGSASVPVSASAAPMLYPSLGDYMGLDITPENVDQNMAVAIRNQQSMQVAQRSTNQSQMVAPITGSNTGLMRAEVKQGVREVIVCKDAQGKIGLRVKSVNKGVFIAFVHADSPAALAGLRFGDQILQINGENVAGWDTDKTMKHFKKVDPQKINLAIRDRPFERTITLQKDSIGTVGFVFKENKITAIVKDSSAARNGVLIDHHLLEVNGQNVVGLKEKDIRNIIETCGRTVTITVIPSFIYDHIIKSMGSSLIKKHMDHSVPDI